ncbi:Arm DNA-binding domain-containing protein [Rhodoferax sp. PAMC 29310]|uniref:Arm DNA-binding domain-containing protein n=1 Tax=Rhodoferax sp. PAMC 29310 TaxID=2822760 RepID=UPI00351D6968
MLTDAQCRHAVCPSDKNRARFTDAGGLYLEVSPAGSKRWFWKTYFDGKEGRMAFGSYPDVSLTAARKARDAAKLQVQWHRPSASPQIGKTKDYTHWWRHIQGCSLGVVRQTGTSME